MKISKIHQKFSKYLNQPDVLKNPEKYLGPNWKDVLNFWIYIETLSKQEREEMRQRYWALDDDVRYCSINTSRVAPDGVIGEDFRFAAWLAAVTVTRVIVFGTATEELIANHKLLEQGKTPLALSTILSHVLEGES
jgi:hypothetical protein